MIRLFLLFVLTIAAVLPQSAVADDLCRVTSSKKLNVRAAPSKNAPIIYQLKPGEIVRRVESQGAWDKVIIEGGQTAYVASAYLAYEAPYRQEQSAARPSNQNKSSGLSPTWCIIILIVSSFLIMKIIDAFDPGSVGRWIIRAFGCVFFGGIAGLFGWWIFDSFFTPFIIVAGGFAIFAVICQFSDDDSSYSGSDAMDWSGYRSSGSSSSYSSSSSSSSSRSSSYDSNEREEEQQRQSDNSYFNNQADDAYRSYEDYRRRAAEAESRARTYESYADDYEYRARENDDSSLASLAASNRRDADRAYSRAREYEAETDRYYSLYQEYKSRVR